MFMSSMIPLITSIMLMLNNTFISLEIPLINLLSMNIPISIMIDWISCMFLSTVMFISSMILMFSTFYIPNKEHKQFSLMMLMFILSMSILIMSDNIIFILLGWDGLGLSSYILVIYYQNSSSAASGSITILSNRVGDIMILMSIGILMSQSNWNFIMNEQFTLISSILLLTAACSKSAQFPFSAWLPAAMAAPTPISALVHSSTLVTAGVFLLIRIMNFPHPLSMLILMLISSSTAIYAGMSANWEQDMKKIIALSTLSQIAMMMFAVSIQSSSLAFFHLITHALFKSTMFLCAGVMIHNLSYQDSRMMGINSLHSPFIPTMLGITSMALMGLPFMSGFFSKDSIIENMISSKLQNFLSIMMIISIGLTASYSIRMSLLSNKNIIKSKSDTDTHKNMFSTLPIMMMTPFSIFSGSLLLWSISPEQMFIFPQSLKLSILLALFTGISLGTLLSFKKKSYISLGESSISLWFTHFLTSSLMIFSSPLMNITMKNDKMWQEMYGPQKTFSISKHSSSPMESSNTSLMFTLMLMMMIPPMILWL
uniref:NADH dehydrogenase subunit 5 n=1 Tax=Heteropoda venatoria TaxID=152925 RepID=UPI0027DA4F4F|nr:NADH dehydrogenase subunit 5 [Heteropoda venatoria]WCS92204.1 NADH dehydrogenase subunit 5 [Heteropoda venatoria]